MKKVKEILRRLGLRRPEAFPSDFDEHVISIIREVRPFTMTSCERLFTLIEAVKYVKRNDIKGAFVECGVWRGGSVMAMAKTLLSLNSNERDMYLFDTFSGMSSPTQDDVSYRGENAISIFEEKKTSNHSSDWCCATIEDVSRNVVSTGYPPQRLHFVQGKVEDTIPAKAPDGIALLRLDTDWYESTRHELEHLFPRLEPGGILIIDDYGYWKGARKAVDEYIEKNNLRLFLSRIDDTGRLAIKLPYGPAP